MRHDPWDMPDLRRAFGPMPETCRSKLLDKIQECKKEEQEMIKPRKVFRPLLVAAVLVLLLSTVAVAASQGGLKLFMDFWYGDRIHLPDAAQNVLEGAQAYTWTVGPLTFTVEEALWDGQTVYVSTRVTAADGQKAIFWHDDDYVPDHPVQKYECEIMGLPIGTTYEQVVAQATVPCYRVMANLAVDEQFGVSDGMAGSLRNEDGSLYIVNAWALSNAGDAANLTGHMELQVWEIQPDQPWQTVTENQLQPEVSFPIRNTVTEADYIPTAPALAEGFTVTAIHAKQTCTGTYLTVTCTAEEGLAKDSAGKVYDISFCDEAGVKFPWSIGTMLCSNYNDEAWPVVVLETAVGLDALPEAITVEGVVFHRQMTRE